MIGAKLATAVNSAASPIAWQPDKAVDLVAAKAAGGRVARILRVTAKATQVAPYAEAEVAARAGRVGLWHDVAPVAPWEWRHKK